MKWHNILENPDDMPKSDYGPDAPMIILCRDNKDGAYFVSDLAGYNGIDKCWLYDPDDDGFCELFEEYWNCTIVGWICAKDIMADAGTQALTQNDGKVIPQEYYDSIAHEFMGK